MLGLAAAAPASAAGANAPAVGDGRHGFDFLMGTWSTHYRRLRHPLSGSNDWYGFDGTSVVRPLWDGQGNVEDGTLDMPQGRVLGMTVRIYNAQTRRWSLYWGTASKGILMPPQVGSFDANGVGQFFADDTFGGKNIIVRYKWSHSDADHCRFEQAFSADKGKTWETNWTTDYTRTR
jgi:hypothetical protein